MATVATLATCAPAETRNIIESDYVFVVNTVGSIAALAVRGAKEADVGRSLAFRQRER